MLAFAVSFFMRAGYTPDASFGVLIVPMLVQGVAMSTFFVSMITIQLADVPPEKIPAASGLSNFARITAGGFAASLITAFWDRREAVHQTQIADIQPNRLPEWTAAFAGLEHLGLSAQQSLAALIQQVVNQAYTIAALDLFWISGWLAILMIPLIWLARRSVSQGATVAAD
jgi:DHA2 family multidrug resistance protein